jgi:hypothetical protein
MSTTTSPIPVLRGCGGTTLQAEEDALVLRRQRKEKRIPLQVVRHVSADGHALAVELTALDRCNPHPWLSPPGTRLLPERRRPQIAP